MSVATAYAKALFEAATESGIQGAAFDQIETQMEEFASLLVSSRETEVALVGPITNAKEKAAIVEAFGKQMGFQPMLIQFLSLMATNGRMSLIKPIREAFSEVRLAAEGGLSGQLVAADPIGEADVAGLAQAFGKKLGKKVTFRVSTDPSLLAGMKVTVNGTTYDGSLRSQLQRLRDRFLAGITG